MAGEKKKYEKGTSGSGWGQTAMEVRGGLVGQWGMRRQYEEAGGDRWGGSCKVEKNTLTGEAPISEWWSEVRKSVGVCLFGLRDRKCRIAELNSTQSIPGLWDACKRTENKS